MCCFLIVEFYVLCVFWLTVLYQICILQIYPPRLCLILLVIVSLQCRAFNFNEAQFTSASFHGSYQGSCVLKQSSSNPRLSSQFPVFSRSFTVVHCAWRSVVHFEFIFVKGLKSVSGFFFCTWMSSHSTTIFLKRLSFLYCMPFLLCQTSANYPVGFFQGSLFYSTLLYLQCYQSSWSFLVPADLAYYMQKADS